MSATKDHAFIYCVFVFWLHMWVELVTKLIKVLRLIVFQMLLLYDFQNFLTLLTIFNVYYKQWPVFTTFLKMKCVILHYWMYNKFYKSTLVLFFCLSIRLYEIWSRFVQFITSHLYLYWNHC